MFGVMKRYWDNLLYTNINTNIHVSWTAAKEAYAFIIRMSRNFIST